MAKDTKIEWTDSTCNAVMGCAGCELWTPDRRTCYAGTMHQLYAGKNKGFAKDFLKPQMFPGRTALATAWSDLRGKNRKEKPWLNGLPRLIFLSDMGDALSPAIDFEYLWNEHVVPACSDAGRRHQWLWLTKQTTRMSHFDQYLQKKHDMTWPSNIWAMTSITGRRAHQRAKFIKEVGDESTIRGISFEPLDDEPDWEYCLAPFKDMRIAWAIFGGESATRHRGLNVEWLRRGFKVCDKYGVAPFVKQLGAVPYMLELTIEGERAENAVSSPIAVSDDHGGKWEQWPQDLRRREMPMLAPVMGAAA